MFMMEVENIVKRSYLITDGVFCQNSSVPVLGTVVMGMVGRQEDTW